MKNNLKSLKNSLKNFEINRDFMVNVIKIKEKNSNYLLLLHLRSILFDGKIRIGLALWLKSPQKKNC